MDHDKGQFRRPSGDEGRLLLQDMNVHHLGLTEWALSRLPLNECGKILDIGCGGGMLISLLAKRFPDAEIYGIDISEESVAVSIDVNKDIVDSGRCRITTDTVSHLPFRDGMFDLVTAFETYFFWPDLRNDIGKAAAKVRNGGYIVIVSETYPHPAFKERNDEIIESYGLNLLDNEEMASLLDSCGMDVTVNEIEENNWVAFVGRKR
ncbi:MAG: class I SAM-dependent methyltransferase [Methanomassiliicoccaceae archaeon]|jgi:SAM-dependent methyltransferase|nr:class I SAM-dependent methyltransferase [Methanomassiliicoccaceae archaeon]